MFEYELYEYEGITLLISIIIIIFIRKKIFNLKLLLKDTRQKILTSILRNHTAVSKTTEKSLNWELMKKRTEGYVAKDMENIVSRALHQHILRKCRGKATAV